MRRRAFGFAALALLAASTFRLVQAVDAQTDPKVPKGKAVKALLVVGGCCHDYRQQKDLLTRGISERANVEWTVAYDPDTTTKHLNPLYENPDWAKGFDVVVHNECSADVKDPAVIDRILRPHREGVPSVVLHCGMHSYRSEGFPNDTPWFRFTGLKTTGHGPQLPIAVTVTDRSNPIVKGLPDWTTGNEELYNNLPNGLASTARPLISGRQVVRAKDGTESLAQSVVAWTQLYEGKTRVFATTLGHNNATVVDPRYLDLVARGLLWSVDRLDR